MNQKIIVPRAVDTVAQPFSVIANDRRECGNHLIFNHYAIASVVVLLRNDITKLPRNKRICRQQEKKNAWDENRTRTGLSPE